MKVAIVHDYIKEFGGAERVLEVLTEIFPNAPIYTAFCDKSGTAYEHFKNKKIIPSWVQYIPFFSKLASPLRFMTPWIWGSFNLSQYDVVISSASWYITKGFRKDGDHFIEICYCHTPPRWLYGYNTSVNFQKYPLVKLYAAIVGHFMRLYDFKMAQKVDYFIANSKEVERRIKKFYRRDATVIYPPVGLECAGSPHSLNDSSTKTKNNLLSSHDNSLSSQESVAQFKSSFREGARPFSRFAPPAKDYYLIVSRIVGAKGLELAVEAAIKAGFKLKIAGSPAGYYFEHNKLVKKAKGKVEFLGQVTDKELVQLYKGAKAFLALSKDEDFGITPVEAMLCGTPVIAFNGGGYKESVINKKTGLLFDELSSDGLIKTIKQLDSLTIDPADCIKQANKFSKERFKKEIKDFVEKIKVRLTST